MTENEIQQFKDIFLQTNNSLINTIKTSLSYDKSADHDLLVIVNNEIGNIRKDIREFTEKNTDLENRVRKLEGSKIVYYTMTAIYAGIGSVMIGLIIWHLFQT